MGELSEFAAEICDSLNKATGTATVVCDRDTVIAVSGAAKRELLDKPISAQLSDIMDGRGTYRHDSGGSSLPVSSLDDKFCLSVAAPVISEGDIMGCVMFVTAKNSPPAGEAEYKVAQTVANFLGHQMEG